MSKENVICNFCDKCFATSSNLYKHIRIVHKPQNKPVECIPGTSTDNYRNEVIQENQLPPGYTYLVKNVLPYKEYYVNLVSEEDVKEWMNAFSSITKTTWTVDKTFPNLPQNVIYKKKFKCHHKVNHTPVEASGRSSKQTGCLATITISINKCEEQSKNLPGVLRTNNTHNHLLDTAAALKHRRMSDDTREKLLGLFRQGHQPASALHCLKTDLLLEHEDDYLKFAADGAYAPSISKVEKLFKKDFVEQFGDLSGENMFQHLQKMLCEYSRESSGAAEFAFTQDGQHYFVVICTPIMTRVHEQVPQSSELVLVDASGGMDKERHRVYFFVTPTAAGGLPLAAIISDTEKAYVFNEALGKLKNMVPKNSFHGKKFPKIFLTDNDLKEREPLQNHFPDSKLLLCQFHFLKSVWSWLCDTKHKIDTRNRQELYYLVKNILYAGREEEAYNYNKIAISSPLMEKYSQFLAYYIELWNRREDWATYCRRDWPLRGNNTTNYVEIVFRILKECILKRILAYSLTQLVHFILTRYEMYVEKRLIDFCNGRYPYILIKRYLPSDSDAEVNPHPLETGVFQVKSKKSDKLYDVDIIKGVCSCVQGMSGNLCCHSSAVLHHLGDEITHSFTTVSQNTKCLFFSVATGKQPPPGWFLPLHTRPESVRLSRTDNLSISQEELPNITDTTEDSVVPTVNSNISKTERECPSLTAKEREEFERVITRMREGISNNPDIFVPAAKKMLQNIKNCASTENGLVSAMHTFATYTGCKPSKKKNRLRGAAMRATARSHASTIGIQPTSLSRRELYTEGRSPASCGKPRKTVKALKVLKHDYTTLGTLPRRKRRAQHALQDCVYANKGLGGTKHAKL